MVGKVFKIKSGIILLCFLLFGSVFVPTVKAEIKERSFADNERISVVLSNRDINRVVVTGDKIQGVNGPTGLYIAKNDVSGSAYISVYGDTVFTIFISTTKGHNFSLLVTPKKVAGKTVVLRPTTPPLLVNHRENAESYKKTLISLMRSMVNNESLEDYAYSRLDRPSKKKGIKKTDFYGIADIKPIATYSGSYLLGVISEIRNKSKKPITLKPSYFYKLGVRAVALSQQTIAPSATGLLYQVISR